MALTKPAGVFLQILSIPVMLGGCVVGVGGEAWGWLILALGIWLLVQGGKPAREAAEHRRSDFDK